MASVFTDYGEEWVQRAATQDISVATVSVGLYNDSTDGLGDSNDIGDISTEPTGSAYSRQDATMPDDITYNQDGSTNLNIDVADQTFDISDSTATVDYWFVVVSFQASVVSSDGGATTHLIAAGPLSQSYDLSAVPSLT